MITIHCTWSYCGSFFCIVQAEKRRAERPPGSRDAKVRESFLEEVVPELSMKGWIRALPGRVAAVGGVESKSKDLEVRRSCNRETRTILWNREWAVRNDLERWEVITSYATVSRSWRSFRRWALGQESTIQNKVLCKKASSTRTCSFTLGRGVMPLGEGWWG